MVLPQHEWSPDRVSSCEAGTAAQEPSLTFLTLFRSIRLGEHRAFGGSSGALSTLASIPFFLIGVASTGWAWATEKFPQLDGLFGGTRPYRHVPVDDDG